MAVFIFRSVKQHLKILKTSTPWMGNPCVGLVLEFRSDGGQNDSNSFHDGVSTKAHNMEYFGQYKDNSEIK